MLSSKQITKFFLLLILSFSLTQAKAEEAITSADELDPAEKVFLEIYDAWNNHDAEKLFSFYSTDFLTGDGINKTDYRSLTEALWKAYPNIKVENQKRTIRSQDQYATISGIDFFFGETSDTNKDLNQKGILNAISQGQIFLQKSGKEWRVVSDKIQFELVTVYYGNAKEYLDNHQVFFSSPEQVKAGEQYSATLYSILPENVRATATIAKELVKKPDNKIFDESFQPLTEHRLERLFNSNEVNYNELVSTTVIFSKGLIEPKLDGILYISKRVNVSPKPKNTGTDSNVVCTYAATYKKPAKEEKIIEKSKKPENSETKDEDSEAKDND